MLNPQEQKIDMDKYRHLGTLLLRCLSEKLENYHLVTCKEDNNFYLICENETKTRIVQLNYDAEDGPLTSDYFASNSGKFSIGNCLNNVNKLNVNRQIDYFICTNCSVVANDVVVSCSDQFILRSLYKVHYTEAASIDVYVTEASSLDLQLELRTFCSRHDFTLFDFQVALDDFCSYLKNNVRYLSEKTVTATLLYLFLSQYKLDLNFVDGIGRCQYNSIWGDITSDMLLTIVDSSSCVGFLENHTLGAVVRRAKSKCDLENLYKNLWLSNEVSLLLQVDNSSDFVNVLNILSTFRSNLRVTMLSDRLALPKVTRRCFATLNDLNDSRRKSLLDFDVNVQNRFTIKLDQILSDTTRKSFKCSDIIRVLGDQDVGFRPLPDYYIERSFLKVVLSLNVFEEVPGEFFLVRNRAGTGNMLLKRLLNKNLSNVRVVEDREDFEVPCAIVHFVEFYGEDWVEWKNSLGDTTNLRAYDISSRANFCCDLAALLDENRRVIVVSAGAGMGKSMLLNAIAWSLPKDCWVELVDLCKYEKDFREHDPLFQYFVAHQRVHVLIDGCDQALVSRTREALQSLEHLKQLGFTLWIVARPGNAQIIENHLKTISVHLTPFTAQNHNEFLSRYFRHTSADSREFVEELLKILRNVFGDFTHTPLHLQILAELFVHHYKKFLMTGILDLENQFRLIDVLEAFLKARADLLCTKYDVSHDFMKHWVLLALAATFDESDLVSLGDEIRCSLVLRISSDEEIIESDRFKCDIFNDYLAAKWLSLNLGHKDEVVQDAIKVLLRRRFSNLKRFAGVFTMLDYILAKDCPLHTALIKGKAYQVQMQAQSPLFVQRDMGGRTTAHIAALYGAHHPKITNNAPVDTLDKMASIIALSDEKLTSTEDVLLGYNSLDYALATGSLAVANAICEKLPALSTSVFLNLSDLETYFDYCVKVNSYKHLYKHLLKHVLTQLLLQDKILVGVTVDSFVQALDFDEMIQDNISEYIQTFDASVVSHLLEALQVKSPDSHTYTNLHLACAFGSVDNVMSLLMDGAQINRLQLYTPLHAAVIHKRTDLIDALLSFGAKIDCKDALGNTALHLACQSYCNSPTVEKLLQHNASTSITNVNGDTPLHCALKFDVPDVARLFLPKKRYQRLLSLTPGNYSQSVPLDAQNNDGETPLLLAIKTNYAALVHELLASYANVNIVDAAKNSCLHYAASNQDSAILTELVYRYVHVNGINDNGETPLLVALRSCKTGVAKVLIAKGADVNATDKDFMSCLHYAVLAGRKKIVLDLLQVGANIDKKNNVGITPLMHAIINERPTTANLLILRGADVNVVDDTGSSALHHTAMYNHNHVARALISHGAKVDAYNNDGETPLIVALKHLQSLTVKTLLSQKADVSVRDKNGSTCLHLAAAMPCPDVVRKILAQNVDINSLDAEGNTPLIVALDQQLKCVAQLLLAKGADVFVANRNGFSAMHYAVKLGLEDFVTEFIKRGMDVNQKTATGDTPLILHVAHSSRRSMVKLLTDNGADVSAVDNATGNSCMHYLVKGVDDDTIGDVVAKGAYINWQNNNGDTPLHFAIKVGYPCTVQLLLSLGADPNIADYGNGSTSLHWAIAMRDDEGAQALVENGADINKENNDGETPLTRARRLGFNSIVRIMTEKGGTYQSYKDLCQAVKKGDIFTVKKLLTGSIDVDMKNDEGNTLLMLALEHGEVGIADYLIARGANVHLTNNRGYSSLHYAASCGNNAIVRLHLDRGVDVNIADINGDTPLIAALYSQNRHVVELLLEREASVELSPVNNPKQTTLHYAIEAGFDDVVLQILQRGFCINKLNIRGSTPLMKSLSYKQAHVSSLLVEKGADINAQNESRASCLHLAATEGMMEMVQLLLDNGANVNALDSVGDTPLMNAIECDNDAIAKLLLSLNADVYAKNSWVTYSLHLAASSNMDDVIPLILDAGFDINTENHIGDTPLFVALNNRKIGTAQMLWKRGASINTVNSYNTTCLHVAVEAGYEDLVLELLNNSDFSVTDRNSQSYTPLSLALNYDQVHIAKMLFQHVLNLDYLDEDYDYLHLAAEYGDLDVMQALLDKGLSINNENKEGETPLIVALRQRQWYIADLLLSRGADVNIVENEYGRSCLYYIAASAQDRLLLGAVEKGADVNAQQFDGATPLMEAIKLERCSLVKLLLSHGADANVVDNDGRTALHYAATTTDKILTTVIKTIDDVNKRGNDNETALFLALQSSQYDLAKILLEHGATDLNCDGGSTCLHYVAENGADDLLVWIADKFGNIDAVDADGNTPLMLGFKYDKEMVLESLLERGADTNIVNKDGCLCIHYAVSCASNLSRVIDRGHVNDKDKSGLTPLMIAINNHNTESALLLIEHGSDVAVEDASGNNCLHLAAKCHDDVLMKALLEKGLDVNATNKSGENCLQIAIEKGDLKIVKMLLDMGGDPNTVAQFGSTCLLKAVAENDEELATKLIEQNVDINVQSNNEQTPLLAALDIGQSTLAKLLIAKGADVNVRRRTGNCLHFAIEHGVDVVAELLDAGLDVNHQDENGFTPLHVALKSNRVDVVQTLLDRGADLNLKNNDGTNCLHYAASDHDEDFVRLFLERGVSVNERTTRGNTVLLEALQHEKLDNAKVLLANGAAFDVRNYKGNSCLYYAAKAGFEDLVDEFIEKGDSIDKLNYNGYTPFLAALRNSQASTAKLLLEKGADVNARGHCNVTWLDYVVGMNDVTLMDLIIKKGADINYGLNNKFTALLLALREGQKVMADFLISRGANVHLVDLSTGDSCLHLAAKAGYDDIVNHLIGEGLDLNRRNNSKETPLRLAFQNQNATTVQLLLSRGALTPPESFSSSYLHHAAELGNDDITLQLIQRGLDLNCRNDDGDTPVFVALAKEHLSIAKLLLEHGSDIFVINAKGHNLLHYAVAAEADDIKAELIEKGLVDDC